MKLLETYKQDEVHDEWVEAYRNDPIQDAFNERILERVIAVAGISQDAFVLDAGCGTGNHTKRWLQRGFRCVAVDISHDVQRRAVGALTQLGLGDHVQMSTQALEELAFRDETFDVVHCRGVLMHIPEWEQALVDLCRVLKTGGRIVILEANHRSVETALVRVVRAIRTNKSEVRHTDGGLEFWSQQGGQPFVARVANLNYIEGLLGENGITVAKRFATEFWDLNRFPPGFLRSTATRFNQAWFSLRLPASLSVDNAIVGVKT